MCLDSCVIGHRRNEERSSVTTILFVLLVSVSPCVISHRAPIPHWCLYTLIYRFFQPSESGHFVMQALANAWRHKKSLQERFLNWEFFSEAANRRQNMHPPPPTGLILVIICTMARHCCRHSACVHHVAGLVGWAGSSKNIWGQGWVVNTKRRTWFSKTKHSY